MSDIEAIEEAIKWWKSLGDNPLQLMINQGELVNKYFGQFRKPSSLKGSEIQKIYESENL